jgi:hypothetical protein
MQRSAASGVTTSNGNRAANTDEAGMSEGPVEVASAASAPISVARFTLSLAVRFPVGR